MYTQVTLIITLFGFLIASPNISPDSTLVIL
jgi:hypothetical protein